MTEQELRERLSRPVELPPEVEESIAAACAQAERAAGKRGPRRGMRTLLVAAVMAGVLCMATAAGYAAVRGEVLPDLAAAVEALFGNERRGSTQAQEAYDDLGRQTLNLPDRERMPVDGEQALALVGDYLPETGYVWQVGEYTLTVESYLLDEHTGTGRVYFTLERPGGVEGLTVSPEDGETWADGSGIALNFCTLDGDGTWRPMSGRFYADQGRSTEEKLFLTAALGEETGWRAADGLRIRFLDLRRNLDSERDRSLVAELELPGLASLPAAELTDLETGERAALSAIGLLLRGPDVDQVGRVEVEYADGTSYVVIDWTADLDNTEYALGWTGPEGWDLALVFNRLVDPAQVVSVTVDGRVYGVER